MPDKFQIEIVSSGEELRSPATDDATLRRQQQIEAKRRRDEIRDAEARRRSQRADRYLELREQQEKDRQTDRANREQLKLKKEHEKFEKDLDRQEKKREQERLRELKQEEIEYRKTQTLRRRFINDFFGAFNNAHLGRRINHMVDSFKSIFNFSDKAADKFESVEKVFTNTSSKFSTVKTTVEKGADYAKQQRQTAGTTPDQQGGHTIRNAAIGSTISRGAISGLSRLGGTSATGAIASGAGGGSGAAGGAAAAGAAGAGGFVGLAAAATVVGAVLLALAIVVGALVVSFYFVVHRVGRLAKELEKIPGQLNLAKTLREIERFQRNLVRAERFGPALAEREREKARQEFLLQDIGDAFNRESAIKANTELNRTINSLLEEVKDLSNVFGNLILEPIFEGMNQLLKGVNDFRGDFQNNMWTGMDAVAEYVPILGSIYNDLKKASRSGSGISSELNKEIANFLNNPELAKRKQEFDPGEIQDPGEL